MLLEDRLTDALRKLRYVRCVRAELEVDPPDAVALLMLS